MNAVRRIVLWTLAVALTAASAATGKAEHVHQFHLGDHVYLNVLDDGQAAKDSPDSHIPLLSFETPQIFPSTVRFQISELDILIHNQSDTTASHDLYLITVINDQNGVFDLHNHHFDDAAPGSSVIWVPRNGSASFTLQFQPLSYDTTYTGRVRLQGAGGIEYFIELEGSTAPCC